MSLRSMLSQDITIVHPAVTTDRYRNETLDWSTATRTVVKGRLEQTDTIEVAVGRETVIGDATVYLLPDAAIAARDRVEASGRSFEVIGQPNLVTTPRGPHHYEVRLRSVTG